MSSEATHLSRRQFLSACGAVGASAALTSAPATADGVQNAVSERFPSTAPGQVSLKGKAEIAKVDRQLAQQRGPIEQTLNAVADLGIDPGAPINETLPDAVSGLSNVRVEFPGDISFRATDRMVLDPAGPIELIGNGTRIQLESGTRARMLNCPELPGGTLIQGFVLDATAPNTVSGVRAGTDGAVELRDITLKGYVPANPYSDIEGILMPIARTPGSTVRVTNFQAIGGTAAGLHDDNDKPSSAIENRLGGAIGLWVGQSNLGTIQMVNCRMRGWSNGTYSSRTEGRVQILGGAYWNNINCQARIGGGSIIDGATMLLDDRQWSMKQNPGPYSLGENQGVHAVRVETGGNKGNQSDPVTLRNLDIRGMSMETSSSLINFEGSAPGGIIENCRITNHIDVPILLGAAPGSQGPYGAAPQTNIMVDNCLFQGSTTEVARVIDRPNSRIQRTCIQIPGAGPESISGMQIGPSVGFGRQCESGGLKNPKQVGSSGNISSLPAPSYNGSVGVNSGSGGGGWGGKLLAGLVAAPLIGVVVMILPIILSLIVVGAVTFGGLFLFFKKLSS